ncbi:hypothetical protein ACET3Z_028655 [Daucus carota]
MSLVDDCHCSYKQKDHNRNLVLSECCANSGAIMFELKLDFCSDWILVVDFVGTNEQFRSHRRGGQKRVSPAVETFTRKKCPQREDNLPTFIRRNNLYLSIKTTLLISGSVSDVIDVYMNKYISSGTDAMEDEATEKRRIRMTEKRVRVFPPVLSSLNRNGRPRFGLEKVRKEGRLQMWVIPNHFSEVVRTLNYGDRVSMELLETGAH